MVDMLSKQASSTQKGSSTDTSITVNEADFVAFLEHVVVGTDPIIKDSSSNRSVKKERVFKIKVDKNRLHVEFASPVQNKF